MSVLKPVLLQTKLFWEDKKQNLLHLDNWLQQVQPSADFVLLPEMFSTAFSMNTSLADTMDGETIDWMKQHAIRLNKPIGGSLMVKEDGTFYNRFIWMKPNGQMEYYNKRHLFRIGNEHNYFEQGTERMIIEHKGWKLFPVVCYDLRFPVWLRRTQTFDYDAMLIVANWPERREQHWRVLLQARAIENQCYIIAVNRVGVDGHGLNHSGYSGILSPKGEWIVALPNEESLIQAEINKQEVIDWRTSFPAAYDADRFTLT